MPQEAEAMLLDTRSSGYLTKPIDPTRLNILLTATLTGGNLGRHAEAVVVEDDRATLKMVARTFAHPGIYVVPFTASELAVRHILNKPIEVANFDFNLLGESGLDACEVLRGNLDTT